MTVFRPTWRGLHQETKYHEDEAASRMCCLAMIENILHHPPQYHHPLTQHTLLSSHHIQAYQWTFQSDLSSSWQQFLFLIVSICLLSWKVSLPPYNGLLIIINIRVSTKKCLSLAGRMSLCLTVLVVFINLECEDVSLVRHFKQQSETVRQTRETYQP